MKNRHIYILLFSLCIMISCATPGLQSGLPAIQKGDTPPDLAVKTLDGHEMRISDYKGKVIVLVFWKTWCNACKIELQQAKNLLYTYHDTFKLFAVNIGEDPSIVQHFKRRYSLPFPIVLDLQTEISSAYGIRVWPTTIIINQKGQVHWIGTGSEIEPLIEQIELLLEENK